MDIQLVINNIFINWTHVYIYNMVYCKFRTLVVLKIYTASVLALYIYKYHQYIV